jgi:alkylation response protein AidB-like acyl-CoA dehydrogenase
VNLSDATNLRCSIVKRGSSFVVNGRKHWTSGALDPRCKVILLIGKGPAPKVASGTAANRHNKHSIVIIPMDTHGVRVIRYLTVFGFDDAPHGHAEMSFENVVVDSKASLLLGEGRGFEAAQSRLGGGRLHHCMRVVGIGERALEMLVDRAVSRVAFGKKLTEHGLVQHQIGHSRCDVEQARLLVISAAIAVDSGNPRAARRAVAIAKVTVPKLIANVVDRSIQVHGGAGVCQDFVLAQMSAHVRSLRLADGPDEVHMSAIAKQELRDQRQRRGKL